MDKKKIVLCIAIFIAVLALVIYNAQSLTKVTNIQNDKTQQQNTKPQNIARINGNKSKDIKKLQNTSDSDVKVQEKVKKEKHIDINGSNDSYSTLPLSGIIELSDISDNIKSKAEEIISTSNAVYFIKKHGNRIFMIIDNPENIRHGIDFVEISATNGFQTKSTFGHLDKMSDSNNEIWEYDKNSEFQRPLRHTVYNKNGDIDFIEEWNYTNDPIKYEKKNSEGRALAIRKETTENGSDLRVENLIYDKDGNTKLNVTAVYDNEDLKRFTYYDSENSKDSTTLINEYDEGQKIKETVYSSDLKVKNIYTSEYKEGVRTDIKVFDSDNELQTKYLPLSE